MAVCDDLAAHVEGLAIVTRGTDMFLGRLPTEPSECCALVEYSGDPPLRNQSEGAARSGAQSGERPRVQLLCRATDYDTGRSLIQSIWQALDGIVNQTVNGTFYVRVSAINSPFFLMRDDNERWIFAANFSVTKAV
jgi:hypothetical protein